MTKNFNQDVKTVQKRQEPADHECLIAETDLPESIIRRDGPDRPTPEEGELELEVSWIISRWQQDRLLSEKLATADPTALTAVVANVLHLFRKQFLEVPTVATHRKEIFQHLLGLNDLWSIWDWDEQWKLLYKQGSIAREQVSSLVQDEGEKDVLLGVLRAADSLEVVEAVREYISKEHKQIDSGNESIIKFARSISLTMPQFVENMTRQKVVHQPPSTINSSLEKLMAETGLSELQVRNSIISCLASYIGRHPYGQLSLRATFDKLATITVSPTNRGRIEIDAQHELAPVKYLKEKPVSAFVEDQFLVLVKGHSLGLLTYEVTFPTLPSTISYLTNLFGAISDDESDPLTDLRKKALIKATDEFILPKLRREIIAKLRTAAERWSATAGQYLLQDKLMMAPYDPHRLGHPVFGKAGTTAFKVMAVSWGEGGQDAVTFTAIVDDKGRVLDQQRISRLHEKHHASNSEEWDRLLTLVTEHQPSCILVAGRGLATRNLLEDITKEVSRLKLGRTPPSVLYGEDDVARVFSESPRGTREWPDLSPRLRYCISVARRWICPLFELTALADEELLAMAAEGNPLAQVGARETRLKYLHRAAVNVVNLVGVDVNAAISFTWMRAPLKFICGLGPVKAERLIKAIANTSSARLNSRAELAEYLGPHVLTNCASFIRIHSTKGFTSDPLDDTRIHPENYGLARKMAADAMEMSLEEMARDQADGEGSAVTMEDVATGAVIKVMQQPARLDDLLLDEYAKELIKRGQPSKHLTLFDIKAELQRPYADLRTVVKTISAETIFEMLTGESERTLWMGAPVRATVVRSMDRMAMCRLPSGLPAMLPERGERYQTGQTVNAKVVAIKLDRIEVELVPMRAGEVGIRDFHLIPITIMNVRNVIVLLLEQRLQLQP